MEHKEDLSLLIVETQAQNIGEELIDKSDDVQGPVSSSLQGRDEICQTSGCQCDQLTNYIRELEEKCQSLQFEKDKLSERLEKLEEKMEVISNLMNLSERESTKLQELKASVCEHFTPSCLRSPPFVIVMDNFTVRQTENNWWESPPFYSHPCGYKMHLEVRAGGHGQGLGTHTSVYIHLVKGDFDDTLPWPFHADVYFQLINHHPEGRHLLGKVSFTRENDASQRVVDVKGCGKGRGYAQFLHHSRLTDDTRKSLFLKQDCLYFELHKVTVFLDH